MKSLQSSSRSRRTAGDAGFFDLSHTFDGGPQVALKRSNGVLLAKMGDGVGITPFCGPADLDRVRRHPPALGALALDPLRPGHRSRLFLVGVTPRRRSRCLSLALHGWPETGAVRWRPKRYPCR